MDISQCKYWRQLLFDNDYNKKFLINSDSEFHFPNVMKPMLSEHNLQFYVSKVLNCPEEFVEDGLTMQLVPYDLHEAVRHTGGASLIKKGIVP